MKTLTQEQILQNLDRFYGLIKQYLPDNERRKKLLDFYSSIELTLSTSPAGPTTLTHNCFAGGYVDHVIRVTEAALVLDRVWDKFEQKKNYTLEELVFSAINHDLGKLGTNEEPFYVPNDSEWHIKNQGKLFKYNPAITHMRISQRSLYYLQQAGIQMSENEYLSILVHDGLYEETNKPYLMQYQEENRLRSNLPHILHQADFLASNVEFQNR